MGFANYHTHTAFCDGQGEPEDYVLEAINCGLQAIGFSSHASLPFTNNWTLQAQQIDEYCGIINSLKVKYAGLIQIYLGLEIDYLSQITGHRFSEFEELNLDYTIGSVHFGTEPVAGEFLTFHSSEDNFIKIIDYCFNGSTQKFVCSYYESVRNMVRSVKPNIIGHLDLIKKFNHEDKYFSENQGWYRTEILNTLEVIAKYQAILEINTSGLARGEVQEFYPSKWILKEARKLNIPVLINSDAHRPEAVNAKFIEAREAILEAGYTEQMILVDHTWKSKRLSTEN